MEFLRMTGLSILLTEINGTLRYFSAVVIFFLPMFFFLLLLLFYCCCFTDVAAFYLPLVSHVQSMCEKNAKNRSNLTINHTGGSMKLKRRKYEIGRESCRERV